MCCQLFQLVWDKRSFRGYDFSNTPTHIFVMSFLCRKKNSQRRHVRRSVPVFPRSTHNKTLGFQHSRMAMVTKHIDRCHTGVVKSAATVHAFRISRYMWNGNSASHLCGLVWSMASKRWKALAMLRIYHLASWKKRCDPLSDTWHQSLLLQNNVSLLQKPKRNMSLRFATSFDFLSNYIIELFAVRWCR